ncbi:hypothetical protein [Antarctobacter sp.]|uniref:hypothetical protein n=1 Tax=Antarctobacter sp. TaxID=1872577 RepID=UPI003A8E2995
MGEPLRLMVDRRTGADRRPLHPRARRKLHVASDAGNFVVSETDVLAQTRTGSRHEPRAGVKAGSAKLTAIPSPSWAKTLVLVAMLGELPNGRGRACGCNTRTAASGRTTFRWPRSVRHDPAGAPPKRNWRNGSANAPGPAAWRGFAVTLHLTTILAGTTVLATANFPGMP